MLLFSILSIEKNKGLSILDENLPLVSILIAARNESENIISCLKSIELIDYPKDKIEIIIGNDQSIDNTSELISEFIQNKGYYKLIQIESNKGRAKAKANVLGHLFEICNGEIIFITDADITVKPTWIKSIIPYFKNKQVGIVSGTTVVNGKTFFGKMQCIDWLYFSGLLVAFKNIGLKSTAIGNNMAVLKDAYNKTLGYFNFDFSVTEDLALYNAVIEKGYQSVNLLNHLNLNFTKPQHSFINFLHQRKRWLIGSKGLNIKWKLLLLLFAAFYPFIFIIFLFSVKNACVMWFCKIILQSIIIILVSLKLKYKIKLINLLYFEFYSIINSISVSLFYILPIKMVWKNRKF